MSDWIIDLVSTLPDGWEIQFRKRNQAIAVSILAWFPHYPETSGERNHCHRYEYTQQFTDKEIQLNPDSVEWSVGQMVQRVNQKFTDLQQQTESQP